MALQAGEPYQLIATTDPADAQVTVEWSSSDADVAAVDQFGNVTNVYPGERHRLGHHHRRGGRADRPVYSPVYWRRLRSQYRPQRERAGGDGQNGQSSSTSGILAPNTEAVITGASGD